MITKTLVTIAAACLLTSAPAVFAANPSPDTGQKMTMGEMMKDKDMMRQMCAQMAKDPEMMKMMCDAMMKNPEGMKTMCDEMMKNPEMKKMCMGIMANKSEKK